MAASLQRFKVHSFDTDARGVVTAPRLLGYLLEAAGASADELGIGIHQLQGQGLTWVLGRIRTELDEVLSFGDELEVETWPSGLDRLVATREFRLWKAGNAVGRATSSWFVLDMKTRAPVRPQKVLPKEFHPQEPHLVEVSKAIAPLSAPATLQRPFEVRKSDIDLNRHVTAASYVAWAMEAIPDELSFAHRLASLDVQFMGECHLGSAVSSDSRHDREGLVSHRIVRQGDGKELARLESRWVSGPAPVAG